MKIKKGLVVMDQLRFQFNASESEDVDQWVCCAEDCDALVRVTENSVLFEGSSEHSCSPCLTMEVVGKVDGFQFHKVEGDGERWKCLNCDCIIQTGKDNSLKYPHRKDLHKCIVIT